MHTRWDPTNVSSWTTTWRTPATSWSTRCTHHTPHTTSWSTRWSRRLPPHRLHNPPTAPSPCTRDQLTSLRRSSQPAPQPRQNHRFEEEKIQNRPFLHFHILQVDLDDNNHPTAAPRKRLVRGHSRGNWGDFEL